MPLYSLPANAYIRITMPRSIERAASSTIECIGVQNLYSELDCQYTPPADNNEGRRLDGSNDDGHSIIL